MLRSSENPIQGPRRAAVAILAAGACLLAGCARQAGPSTEPSGGHAPRRGETPGAPAAPATPEPPLPPAVGPDRAQTLVYATAGPINFDNPNLRGNGWNEATSLVYGRLYFVDLDGIVRPDLVKQQSVSEDGLTWLIRLRDDVTWHDGRPLTLRDVRRTFREIFDPQAPCDLDLDLPMVESIDYPGMTTFAVHLRYPDPLLPARLTRIAILPARDGPATGEPSGSPAPPVGTGPYRFVRTREDGSLEFQPNAAYHLGHPSIPRIILTRIADDAERARAVAHGQVDLAPIRPEDTGPFRRRSNTWVVRMLTGDWRGMPLNTQHPALQDIRVRQAIDLSLDRREIVAAALPGAGRPAYQPMSPLSFAFSAKLDEPYADPVRARELLDQAGWFTSDRGLRYRGRNPKTQVAFGTAALPPRDAVAPASASGSASAGAAEEEAPDSGEPLTLRVLVPRDDTFRLRAAEVIRAELRRVGILVEIDAVDAAAYAPGTASVDDRYDAWIGEWDSLLDPGGSLYREFHTDGRENRTGYSNATMDKMLDLCRGATDKTAAKDLYERLMENLRPEAVVLPLAYPETLFAARTRVAGLREGVTDSVAGFSRNAWRWHLEEE